MSKEYLYGLADGGTDLVISLPDKVPTDILNLINVLKQEIIEGKLVITPNTQDPEKVWNL